MLKSQLFIRGLDELFAIPRLPGYSSKRLSAEPLCCKVTLIMPLCFGMPLFFLFFGEKRKGNPLPLEDLIDYFTAKLVLMIMQLGR